MFTAIDSNNKIYKFDSSAVIGCSGSSGTVYRMTDELCGKFLYEFNDIAKNMFLYNFFIENDLNNLPKIYSMLKNDDDAIIGYLMQYYEDLKRKIDINDKEYILSNLEGIEKDSYKLANYHISMHDIACPDNFFVNDKIQLIDIDYYHYNKELTLNSILKNNRQQIKSLLKNLLLMNARKEYKNYNEYVAFIEYFMSNIETTHELTPQVERELKYVNTSMYNKTQI